MRAPRTFALFVGSPLLAAALFAAQAEALTVEVSFHASGFEGFSGAGATGEAPPQDPVSGSFTVETDVGGEVYTSPSAVSLEIGGVSYTPASVGAYLGFDGKHLIQLTVGGGEAGRGTAGTDDWGLTLLFDRKGKLSEEQEPIFFYVTSATRSGFDPADLDVSVSLQGDVVVPDVPPENPRGCGDGPSETQSGALVCTRTRPVLAKVCLVGDRRGEPCRSNAECGVPDFPFAACGPMGGLAESLRASAINPLSLNDTLLDVRGGVTLCRPADGPLVEDAGEANLHRGLSVVESEFNAGDRIEKCRGLTVSTRFGTLTLDTFEVDRFLAPAVVSRSASIELPDSSAVDEFYCVEARVAKGTERFRRLRGASVGGGLYDLKRPTRLCFANRGTYGYELLHPRDLLLCFAAKSAEPVPRGARDPLFVTHTVADLEQLELLSEREVCVPADRVE